MRETQELIDADEFGEWLALYSVKPWGDDWGQADAIVWASLGAPQYVRPGQLMPRQWPAGLTPESFWPTPEENAARMDEYARKHGI